MAKAKSAGKDAVTAELTSPFGRGLGADDGDHGLLDLHQGVLGLAP